MSEQATRAVNRILTEEVLTLSQARERLGAILGTTPRQGHHLSLDPPRSRRNQTRSRPTRW